MPRTHVRAVVPYYDQNHALCIEPRAARDCRGPGAFINPLFGTGRTADGTGAGDSNGTAPGDGRDACDDGYQSGRNRRRYCACAVDKHDDHDPNTHRSGDQAGAQDDSGLEGHPHTGDAPGRGTRPCSGSGSSDEGSGGESAAGAQFAISGCAGGRPELEAGRPETSLATGDGS